MIIAIDGPSSSGKGTIAKKIAAHFNYPCLNTGGLYRALAFLALQNHYDLNKDQERIVGLAKEIIDFDLESPQIHNEEIGKAASIIAVNPNIRQAIFDLQRNFAIQGVVERGGAVLEGRDIGTVICPDADYKFFINADAEVRAKRRFEQLKLGNIKADYEVILQQLKARDEQDKNRASSPLKKADDAIVIDTSLLSIEEVFNKMKSIINN